MMTWPLPFQTKASRQNVFLASAFPPNWFSRKSGEAPQKTMLNRMKASQGMDLYVLKARQMGAPKTQENSTRTSLNLTPFLFQLF